MRLYEITDENKMVLLMKDIPFEFEHAIKYVESIYDLFSTSNNVYGLQNLKEEEISNLINSISNFIDYTNSDNFIDDDLQTHKSEVENLQQSLISISTNIDKLIK